MTDENSRGPLQASAIDVSSLGRARNTSGPTIELGPLAAQIAARPVVPAISRVVLAGAVRLVDFALITLVGLALQLAYVFPVEGIPLSYVIAIPATALLAVASFQTARVYDVSTLHQIVPQLGRIAAAWAAAFAIALAVVFFAKLDGMFSRVWLTTWFFAGFFAIIAERSILARLTSHWIAEGRLTRRTVIVGGGEAGEELIEAIQDDEHGDVEIIGFFDDRSDDRSPPMLRGIAKLGTVDDLVEFARLTRIDLLIVSLPVTAEERVLEMLKKLWVLPVDIHLSAHSSRLRLRPRSYSYIGSVPVLPIYDKPIADWDVVQKWLFDRIVGGLMLLALSPVMLAVAIAVKLDSRGPVFFRQRRYGFNNELIEVFKFRSMYVDQNDATAAKLVTKGDPRVTRVGRFIRKTSLDELPQLINVAIFGNLSLVGPRPHALHAKAENKLYNDVVDGYFARHRVKPGITGWAQINGWRGETDTSEKIQKRVEYDLFYIENWSVLFDLIILIRTPFALLKTDNAY
ncbi:undecaprenyl-phosphate glucose phosphotransferase [Bosea sp. 117]|uniref:undecaprenyl-phosphate glucose phosphotransferase n=1 Tax=Bosea sp. 117 TaxID=1125973 RepID=UPI0004941A79|nr:undecaprenyl-phosphate glucose phosphotransferase [Bosea sp. 117]